MRMIDMKLCCFYKKWCLFTKLDSQIELKKHTIATIVILEISLCSNYERKSRKLTTYVRILVVYFTYLKLLIYTAR